MFRKMTKEDKDFKNDLLDVLEQFKCYVITALNKGESLSCKSGSLDDDLEEARQLIRTIRDATIIMDK